MVNTDYSWFSIRRRNYLFPLSVFGPKQQVSLRVWEIDEIDVLLDNVPDKENW